MEGKGEGSVVSKTKATRRSKHMQTTHVQDCLTATLEKQSVLIMLMPAAPLATSRIKVDERDVVGE